MASGKMVTAQEYWPGPVVRWLQYNNTNGKKVTVQEYWPVVRLVRPAQE